MSEPVAIKADVHPLDPLSPAELAQAVALIKADERFGARMRFVMVNLLEPAKEIVRRFEPGSPIERVALAVILDNTDGATYEVSVSLTDDTVTQFKHIPDVQPSIIPAEIDEIQSVVKSNPEVQAALARRGLTDLTLIDVAPLMAGYYGGDDLPPNCRFLRTVLQFKESEDDSPDAHPIDGLHVLVDLNNQAVLRVEDHEILPIPPERGDFAAHRVAPLRDDIRPLDIVQPQGVSFTVDGWEVRWQKWSFRVGFNHREGLTLHQIAYQDGAQRRPLIYRASMPEMTVPYGDASLTQYRKNFFDAGEYGMGLMANSLELGCDCLGEIYYFDGYICHDKGEVETIKNAICLHEEDFSLLWKHRDEVRRSRRLVISFIATVGNYDYGFYWYFYQDGQIQFEIKLTGLVATGAHRPGSESPFGTSLTETLYAPNHQHFFCVRLDTEIDGPANSVVEVDTFADPIGETNPYGNAFYTKLTTLATEQAAQRIIDPFAARYWQISNPTSQNKMGKPVGYKLLPGENTLPFAHKEASVAKRAGYMWKHLWVTPYRPDENYPAGDYPNQHPGGDGLPRWTAADRRVADEDIVVWYVMGSNHIPRLEDWPIMPVATIGFALKPSGFFDHNPALDVPPSMGDHCAH